MNIKSEILKELYESIETANKLAVDEELTDHAKTALIQAEQAKQIKLRSFLKEWNNA